MGLLLKDDKLVWDGTQLLTDSRACIEFCGCGGCVNCGACIGGVCDGEIMEDNGGDFDCPTSLQVELELAFTFSGDLVTLGGCVDGTWMDTITLNIDVFEETWTASGTIPAAGLCDTCSLDCGGADGAITYQITLGPAGPFEPDDCCKWALTIEIFFICCEVGTVIEGEISFACDICTTPTTPGGANCPSYNEYEFLETTSDPELTITPVFARIMA